MKKGAVLLMLIPATALFMISFAVPMALVIRLSFLRYNYLGSTFIGLENYIVAVKDPYFMKSFLNAGIFVLMVVPLSLFVAYKIASFLSDFNEKLQSIGRFLIYIPGLTSGVIMAMLWQWLLKREGLLNHLLSLIHINAIPWLSEPWPARSAIAMILIATGIGGYVIMFSASMHSLPRELKDAAMIDGADSRKYKRHIVLPIMMPTIFLTILLAIVGMMQLWELIYILTGAGGPEGSTSSPVYEIFLTAFQFGKQGLASAKGIILIIVIAGILLIKQRIEKLFK